MLVIRSILLRNYLAEIAIPQGLRMMGIIVKSTDCSNCCKRPLTSIRTARNTPDIHRPGANS